MSFPVSLTLRTLPTTMSSERGIRHHTLSESSGSATGEMLRPDPHHHDLLPAPAHRHQRPRFCESVYLVPTRLATAMLALLQGSILDCYLTHYNSAYWFAWIAGDVAVLMMFVVAFIISYRQMAQVMRRLLQGGGGGGAAAAVPQPSGARFGGSVTGGGGSCCVRGLSMLAGDSLDKEDGGGLVASAGSMPLVYFAWLVYSAVLAIRVLLIYKNFAHELTEEVFLGTNMLQVRQSPWRSLQ